MDSTKSRIHPRHVRSLRQSVAAPQRPLKTWARAIVHRSGRKPTNARARSSVLRPSASTRASRPSLGRRISRRRTCSCLISKDVGRARLREPAVESAVASLYPSCSCRRSWSAMARATFRTVTILSRNPMALRSGETALLCHPSDRTLITKRATDVAARHASAICNLPARRSIHRCAAVGEVSQRLI